MKIFGYKITRAPQNLITPPPEKKVGSFVLNRRPVQIIEANITNFVQAFTASIGQYNQQRTRLYDMYQNAVDFDGNLKGLIEKRILSTSGRKLQYVVNGEPNDKAIISLVESPKWDSFVRDFIWSKVFVGMGLFEFGKVTYSDKDYFDYDYVPARHIDPYNEVVMFDSVTTSLQDKSYKGLEDVVFIGDADNYGLMLQATIMALYKRAAVNHYASYIQLAGENFKEVTYTTDTQDPAERYAIENKILTAGSGVTGLPPGVTVDYKNLSSSQQNDLFEGVLKYWNDEMTKLILGQTMTTESGASRSQAEVHERTQETILDADAKDLLNLLNFDLYEMLPMWGVPSGGVWQYVENASTRLMQSVEFDLKLRDLGYVFTQEQIADKYGLKPQTTTPQPE